MDKEEKEIVTVAIAFIDQLNSFNSFDHPEVKKRAVELQNAVGKHFNKSNAKGT